MRRRILTLTTAYAALIACMTAGWHTWPLAIGLGLWFWGYRIHEDRLTLTNREIRALLRG